MFSRKPFPKTYNTHQKTDTRKILHTAHPPRRRVVARENAPQPDDRRRREATRPMFGRQPGGKVRARDTPFVRGTRGIRAIRARARDAFDG